MNGNRMHSPRFDENPPLPPPQTHHQEDVRVVYTLHFDRELEPLED